MLDLAFERTMKYVEGMTKEDRKKCGQFFTSKSIARYMASMFDLSELPSDISILDPGSGSGILAIALIERLCELKKVRSIKLVCYENDIRILPLLSQNVRDLTEELSVEFDYEIREMNYVLSRSTSFSLQQETFDLVIGNPPYKKIPRNQGEALAIPSVVHGAPNLYFLFMATSISDLEPDGELVYIIPRSWTSGAYFSAFRQYLFASAKIRQIHLFISRSKVFSSEDVLQETIIINMKKNISIDEPIEISSSTSDNLEKTESIIAASDAIVCGVDKSVFLPVSAKDVITLEKINKFTNTLPSIGFKMKTGIVVDFRRREALRDNPEIGAIPLFCSQHIEDGRIVFPIHKEGEWLYTSKRSLMQENLNYLIVKRFSAKEERRRLQCAMYFRTQYSGDLISTQNKVNFITSIEGTMSENEVKGLYVLFNSTIYDDYYRILNGSTQVNSTEVNRIPVPSRRKIAELGVKLEVCGDISTKRCDEILGRVL